MTLGLQVYLIDIPPRMSMFNSVSPARCMHIVPTMLYNLTKLCTNDTGREYDKEYLALAY